MSLSNTKPLIEAIIQRTHRVPVGPVRDAALKHVASEAVSRQLDVALISVGFKASAALLDHMAHMHPIDATDLSLSILNSAKQIVGAHVSHNVYFKEFPKNVPDTLEFWADLVAKTYGIYGIETWDGNLLHLDGYGRYQHSYDEMVKAHEAFVSKGTEKLTVINVGKSIAEEANDLYISLAESKVPAVEDDLTLLVRLAELCVGAQQPAIIPVRENKAIINAVRLNASYPLLIDTTTDVLRLAAHLSGGDVTLLESTKFKSFNRFQRRALLQALDSLDHAKYSDVNQYKEWFKRLGERLHVGDYKYEGAKLAFAIARGEAKMPSLMSRVEAAYDNKDMAEVVMILANAPGLLIRQFNRVLLKTNIGSEDSLNDLLGLALKSASTPVILSLRQYIMGRSTREAQRVFTNRKGKTYVMEDTRPVLSADTIGRISDIIDAEVKSRLKPGVYFVNSDIRTVALPLSNKQTADGLGVLPRGSVGEIEEGLLRFFMYWKESSYRTDYDLSAILLDENFQSVGQLSYTNLTAVGGTHSGDLTSAPKGASEFIELDLSLVNAKYIVPQVNVYSGEKFNEVEESFFGYMERTPEQKGLPYEPKAVETKSELRGDNNVALPLVFIKNKGVWTVKWLNTFLGGQARFNATENNKLSTASVVRGIVEKEFLDVSYLLYLMAQRDDITLVDYVHITPETVLGYSEFTYIGLEEVELFSDRDNIKQITLKNLHELI